LKLYTTDDAEYSKCRAPRGARGLKHRARIEFDIMRRVAPRAGRVD